MQLERKYAIVKQKIGPEIPPEALYVDSSKDLLYGFFGRILEEENTAIV